jgi:hypothetical protein
MPMFAMILTNLSDTPTTSVLEARIPAHHLLRRINPTVTRILAGLREKLEAFYNEIGRPSIGECEAVHTPRAIFD